MRLAAILERLRFRRRSGAAGGGALLPLVASGAALLPLGSCGGEAEIEQPMPLYGEMPIEYPLEAWDLDMEGETLLRVWVTDVGTVDSVVVLESSGYLQFDSAAVAGAKEMRFRPARRDGERIAVWARVPVRFSKRPRPDTLGVASVPSS